MTTQTPEPIKRTEGGIPLRKSGFPLKTKVSIHTIPTSVAPKSKLTLRREGRIAVLEELFA